MQPQWLAQILADSAVVAPADLEQALQRQIVAGGSLDTNLLEMGLATEQQLLAAMAAGLHLPAIDRDALDAADPALAQAFPLVFAETYHLVPYRLQGERLYVAAHTPLDDKLAQRIRERVHVQITAGITCEVRLHYAMHRLYGTRPLPRYAALLSLLDGQASAADAAGPAAHPLGWGVSNARVTAVRSHSGGALSRQDVRAQVARLDAAPDRDTIVDILLSFALAFFDFAGLLLANDQRVQGWRGPDPHSTQRLAQLDVSLAEPSALQTVAQTRGHYLGPMSECAGNAQLLAALARPPPQVVLLAPILVGGKLAAILYADNGSRAIGPNKVAALLMLVQRAGLCLEYLIRRRKDAACETAHAASDSGPSPYGPDTADDSANGMLADSMPDAMADAMADALPDAVASHEAVGSVDADAIEAPREARDAAAPSAEAHGAYSVSWDDVIAEAARAAALTPQRFAAVRVLDQTVDRRDLLFDGLEAEELGARQSAVAGLLALGSSIDAELSRRFPGPLTFDPLQVSPRELPAFARVNGLCELLAARGPDAAAVVLPHLDSDVPIHRWAAVYFLSSVHYPAACEALARRLYDAEPRIRSLAVDALTHYRSAAAYQRIISGLREQLRVPVVETQVAAIQILGQLREPSAVPALIPLVVTPNTLVARSAASALAVVCGQAYGTDLSLWQAWWQNNYTRPRTQWLIGGLSHSNSTIRRVAHGELQRLTGQTLPFKADASAQEQARLLQAWQTSLLPND
jgi:hypothetical protein